MANDDFSDPPRRTHSKIPFSPFAEFWVRVTSGAGGSVSVGFWGARQWSLLSLEGGGGLARGLYRRPPTPPGDESPPTPVFLPAGFVGENVCRLTGSPIVVGQGVGSCTAELVLRKGPLIALRCRV